MFLLIYFSKEDQTPFIIYEVCTSKKDVEDKLNKMKENGMQMETSNYPNVRILEVNVPTVKDIKGKKIEGVQVVKFALGEDEE